MANSSTTTRIEIHKKATNSKDKGKGKDKGKTIRGAAIAAVTLALVTAIVVVSIMPIQSAHASCINSAKVLHVVVVGWL